MARTIDRWQDEHSYEAFRSACADEYEALDAVCARLTRGETRIGIFRE